MSERPAIAVPRVMPQSWRVGQNNEPKEVRVRDGDGELEVRMTFPETPEGKIAIKGWMEWLMDLDPSWGGRGP